MNSTGGRNAVVRRILSVFLLKQNEPVVESC